MEIFQTEIIKDESQRLTYIEIPFNAKEVFSVPKGTIYVSGKINDVDYRGKLLSRGSGRYILVLNKTLQKQTGFNGGRMAVQVSMSSEDNQCKNQHAEKTDTETCQMDIITAIEKRHSVRKFTSSWIDDKKINTILNAGLQAPTAKNKRPYHFVVIKDKNILAELARNNPNARMLAAAACAVAVCGDSNVEGMKEFLYEDCAAASQNILLCSHGLGVGAVWCGVAMNSDWKKLIIEKLNLPPKVEPVSVIALGYPDEDRQVRGRWDAGKIHYDKW